MNDRQARIAELEAEIAQLQEQEAVEGSGSPEPIAPSPDSDPAPPLSAADASRAGLQDALPYLADGRRDFHAAQAAYLNRVFSEGARRTVEAGGVGADGYTAADRERIVEEVRGTQPYSWKRPPDVDQLNRRGTP